MNPAVGCGREFRHPNGTATSTATHEGRDSGPPNRGRVFGEFWRRSLALATAGGFTIGFVVGPVFILAKSDADQKVLIAILAMALGAGIGAAVGVMLGILAGLVIGAVGAIWLVPYRGTTTTNWTLRLVATATVGMWFMLLAQENVYSKPTSFDFWAIDIPALVGAWYVSPWVGGWYVDRMREPT